MIEQEVYTLFAGSYAGADDTALHVLQFRTSDASMHVRSSIRGIANPSFLAVHPHRPFIAAVSEARVYPDGGAIAIFAVRRDASESQASPAGTVPGTRDGVSLELISTVPSCGDGPCHLSFDRTGRFVAAANYGSGSTVAYAVSESGELADQPCSFHQHSGSGPDPIRQEGPHAHSVAFTPDNRYAIVSDLGIDRLISYRFDSGDGSMTNVQETRSEPGDGPRHVAFHPSLPLMYSLNELSSVVEVYRYDTSSGVLTSLQRAQSRSVAESGGTPVTAAELQIDSDARFLYCSNRGSNEIAVFALNAADGTLASPPGIRQVPTGGRTPRHFAIDPSGTYLLVANQDTNTIRVLRRDQADGSLHDTGSGISIPKPVCLLFSSY